MNLLQYSFFSTIFFTGYTKASPDPLTLNLNIVDKNPNQKETPKINKNGNLNGNRNNADKKNSITSDYYNYGDWRKPMDNAREQQYSQNEMMGIIRELKKNQERMIRDHQQNLGEMMREMKKIKLGLSSARAHGDGINDDLLNYKKENGEAQQERQLLFHLKPTSEQPLPVIFEDSSNYQSTPEQLPPVIFEDSSNYQSTPEQLPPVTQEDKSGQPQPPPVIQEDTSVQPEPSPGQLPPSTQEDTSGQPQPPPRQLPPFMQQGTSNFQPPPEHRPPSTQEDTSGQPQPPPRQLPPFAQEYTLGQLQLHSGQHPPFMQQGTSNFQPPPEHRPPFIQEDTFGQLPPQPGQLPPPSGQHPPFMQDDTSNFQPPPEHRPPNYVYGYNNGNNNIGRRNGNTIIVDCTQVFEAGTNSCICHCGTK